MFIQIVWKTFLIFVIGTIILRLGGRKSISQMTIAQVVVMIGIGSLLIQPVSGHGIGYTFLAAFVLVCFMLIFEYLQMKFDRFETIGTGKAKMVIEHGQLNVKNLRMLRLTVDQLETRLREVGIANIEDVEWATIEVSGQLGYALKPPKQPATKEDIQLILDHLQHLSSEPVNMQPKSHIFTEINTQEHEGNQDGPKATL
ncbi:DUF421 domain-containing protein [Hazenella sp. IB182357]|uniref:DUF421 domain-containing protein n=1 Tax=Polycladospora coralii TaxID=2771432 RepID=A0A926RVB3_9BACL|nr:DUF421 domain-containing protein [Polycladospora coralii]